MGAHNKAMKADNIQPGFLNFVISLNSESPAACCGLLLR